MEFPLSTALAMFHKLLFSFSSVYLFISLETSYITHEVLVCCLISKCFEISVLSVMSYTTCDFNFYKFVEVDLMVQDVVYFGICSVSTCKESDCRKCCINIDQILLVDVLLSFYRYLLIFSLVFL